MYLCKLTATGCNLGVEVECFRPQTWSRGKKSLGFFLTSVFPSKLLWPVECASASPACHPDSQLALQPPLPSAPPGGWDVWPVHIRSTAGWSRSAGQRNRLRTAANKGLFSSWVLTVSTPPAISSVTLALMSSMDILSSRSRLARTPGYFFEGPVSWCRRL